MHVRRVGGLAAALAGLALWIVVLARDVGLNVLNAWSIFVGLAAGLAVMIRPEDKIIVVAVLAVVLAMLPGLFGRLGLLYLPAIILMLAGRGADQTTPDL